FEQEQRSEIVLVELSQLLISEIKSYNSLQINPEKPKMIIIWKTRIIKDKKGKKSEA
ncbi:16691_t:CDS:1, partial [Racocetra fulgida]